MKKEQTPGTPVSNWILLRGPNVFEVGGMIKWTPLLNWTFAFISTMCHHVPTTCLPPDYHMLTICLPYAYHMPALCLPYTHHITTIPYALYSYHSPFLTHTTYTLCFPFRPYAIFLLLLPLNQLEVMERIHSFWLLQSSIFWGCKFHSCV